MAPYAFHPRWAESRRPIRERLSYPIRGRLNNGVNRPMQDNQKGASNQVWCAKSPSAAAVGSGKVKEKINADSLILGAKTFTIPQPTVHSNPTEPILAIAPKHLANDHEASTSQAKPQDPKYTQPKWCPLELTKTQKRKLQRLRNQEMAE